MRSGTYVRGWRYDWSEAEQAQEFLAASADPVTKLLDLTKSGVTKALHCADPGCEACPRCGEMHWAAFETFLCARCGAEVTCGRDELAGFPQRPYMVRPKLFDGMRVQFLGRLVQTRDRGLVRYPGLWAAGRIEPGEFGTVRRDSTSWSRLSAWHVDFDGRTPKQSAWGIFGPFLSDEFSPVPWCQHGN